MSSGSAQKSELLRELNNRRSIMARAARFREIELMACRLTSAVCGAMAALIGFISNASIIKERLVVEPWMVSLLAAAAGGIEVFRRSMDWRQKADAFYGARDNFDSLCTRLLYEMPQEPTSEQIAAIAREMRDTQTLLGKRMQDINAQQEAKAALRAPARPEGS